MEGDNNPNRPVFDTQNRIYLSGLFPEQKHYQRQQHVLTDSSTNVVFSREQICDIKNRLIPVHINMNRRKTMEEHSTIFYDIPEIVLRRGQEFSCILIFNQAFHQEKYQLTVIFKSRTWKNFPVIKIPLNESSNGWSVKIIDNGKNENKNHLPLRIYSPSTALIGKYSLFLEIHSIDNKEPCIFQFESDFYLICNPWKNDDSCGLLSEDQIAEYVMNEHGEIYLGSSEVPRSIPWYFGQFESPVLSTALTLLNRMRLSPKQYIDVSTILRILASNICSDPGSTNGVFPSSFDVQPLSCLENGYTSSPAILKQFITSKGRLVAGDSGTNWQHAAVFCSLCRSLGIPCRVVTIYNPISDVKDNNSNITNPWYLWNECWIHRDDVPKENSGWQVMDSSFNPYDRKTRRLGPCSVLALKNGSLDLKYDNSAIYRVLNGNQKLIHDSIKRRILTKSSKANQVFDDLTNDYISSEIAPNSTSSNQNVEIEMEIPDSLKSSEGLTAVLKANNRSNVPHTLILTLSLKRINPIKQPQQIIWYEQNGDNQGNQILIQSFTQRFHLGSNQPKIIPLKIAGNHQILTECFDSSLRLNVHAMIKETGQNYRKEKYITNEDNITMKIYFDNNVIKIGQSAKLNVQINNSPLHFWSSGHITVDGLGILESLLIRRDSPLNNSITVPFKVVPSRIGVGRLYVTFSTESLCISPQSVLLEVIGLSEKTTNADYHIRAKELLPSAVLQRALNEESSSESKPVSTSTTATVPTEIVDTDKSINQLPEPSVTATDISTIEQNVMCTQQDKDRSQPDIQTSDIARRRSSNDADKPIVDDLKPILMKNEVQQNQSDQQFSASPMTIQNLEDSQLSQQKIEIPSITITTPQSALRTNETSLGLSLDIELPLRSTQKLITEGIISASATASESKTDNNDSFNKVEEISREQDRQDNQLQNNESMSNKEQEDYAIRNEKTDDRTELQDVPFSEPVSKLVIQTTLDDIQRLEKSPLFDTSTEPIITKQYETTPATDNIIHDKTVATDVEENKLRSDTTPLDSNVETNNQTVEQDQRDADGEITVATPFSKIPTTTTMSEILPTENQPTSDEIDSADARLPFTSAKLTTTASEVPSKEQIEDDNVSQHSSLDRRSETLEPSRTMNVEETDSEPSMSQAPSLDNITGVLYPTNSVEDEMNDRDTDLPVFLNRTTTIKSMPNTGLVPQPNPVTRASRCYSVETLIDTVMVGDKAEEVEIIALKPKHFYDSSGSVNEMGTDNEASDHEQNRANEISTEAAAIEGNQMREPISPNFRIKTVTQTVKVGDQEEEVETIVLKAPSLISLVEFPVENINTAKESTDFETNISNMSSSQQNLKTSTSVPTVEKVQESQVSYTQLYDPRMDANTKIVPNEQKQDDAETIALKSVDPAARTNEVEQTDTEPSISQASSLDNIHVTTYGVEEEMEDRDTDLPTFPSRNTTMTILLNARTAAQSNLLAPASRCYSVETLIDTVKIGDKNEEVEIIALKPKYFYDSTVSLDETSTDMDYEASDYEEYQDDEISTRTSAIEKNQLREPTSPSYRTKTVTQTVKVGDQEEDVETIVLKSSSSINVLEHPIETDFDTNISSTPSSEENLNRDKSVLTATAVDGNKLSDTEFYSSRAIPNSKTMTNEQRTDRTGRANEVEETDAGPSMSQASSLDNITEIPNKTYIVDDEMEDRETDLPKFPSRNMTMKTMLNGDSTSQSDRLMPASRCYSVETLIDIVKVGDKNEEVEIIALKPKYLYDSTLSLNDESANIDNEASDQEGNQLTEVASPNYRTKTVTQTVKIGDQEEEVETIVLKAPSMMNIAEYTVEPVSTSNDTADFKTNISGISSSEEKLNMSSEFATTEELIKRRKLSDIPSLDTPTDSNSDIAITSVKDDDGVVVESEYGRRIKSAERSLQSVSVENMMLSDENLSYVPSLSSADSLEKAVEDESEYGPNVDSTTKTLKQSRTTGIKQRGTEASMSQASSLDNITGIPNKTYIVDDEMEDRETDLPKFPSRNMTMKTMLNGDSTSQGDRITPASRCYSVETLIDTVKVGDKNEEVEIIALKPKYLYDSTLSLNDESANIDNEASDQEGNQLTEAASPNYRTKTVTQTVKIGDQEEEVETIVLKAPSLIDVSKCIAENTTIDNDTINQERELPNISSLESKENIGIEISTAEQDRVAKKKCSSSESLAPKNGKEKAEEIGNIEQNIMKRESDKVCDASSLDEQVKTVSESVIIEEKQKDEETVLHKIPSTEEIVPLMKEIANIESEKEKLQSESAKIPTSIADIEQTTEISTMDIIQESPSIENQQQNIENKLPTTSLEKPMTDSNIELEISDETKESNDHELFKTPSLGDVMETLSTTKAIDDNEQNDLMALSKTSSVNSITQIVSDIVETQKINQDETKARPDIASTDTITEVTTVDDIQTVNQRRLPKVSSLENMTTTAIEKERPEEREPSRAPSLELTNETLPQNENIKDMENSNEKKLSDSLSLKPLTKTIPEISIIDNRTENNERQLPKASSLQNLMGTVTVSTSDQDEKKYNRSKIPSLDSIINTSTMSNIMDMKKQDKDNESIPQKIDTEIASVLAMNESRQINENESSSLNETITASSTSDTIESMTNNTEIKLDKTVSTTPTLELVQTTHENTESMKDNVDSSTKIIQQNKTSENITSNKTSTNSLFEDIIDTERTTTVETKSDEELNSSIEDLKSSLDNRFQQFGSTNQIDTDEEANILYSSTELVTSTVSNDTDADVSKIEDTTKTIDDTNTEIINLSEKSSSEDLNSSLDDRLHQLSTIEETSTKIEPTPSDVLMKMTTNEYNGNPVTIVAVKPSSTTLNINIQDTIEEPVNILDEEKIADRAYFDMHKDASLTISDDTAVAIILDNEEQNFHSTDDIEALNTSMSTMKDADSLNDAMITDLDRELSNEEAYSLVLYADYLASEILESVVLFDINEPNDTRYISRSATSTFSEGCMSSESSIPMDEPQPIINIPIKFPAETIETISDKSN